MLCIAIIPSRIVALMITDSQTQAGKIMMKEIEKKGRETRYFNFKP